MHKKLNPQIRIRMSVERQAHFHKLAKDAGMDFSEWIEDRLLLLADDKEGTASKIAEMVLAIWRICEVANGTEISLQHPLASKALSMVGQILASNVDYKNNSTKVDAARIKREVEKYSSLSSDKILSIGSMLRSHNEASN